MSFITDSIIDYHLDKIKARKEHFEGLLEREDFSFYSREVIEETLRDDYLPEYEKFVGLKTIPSIDESWKYIQEMYEKSSHRYCGEQTYFEHIGEDNLYVLALNRDLTALLKLAAHTQRRIDDLREAIAISAELMEVKMPAEEVPTFVDLLVEQAHIQQLIRAIIQETTQNSLIEHSDTTQAGVTSPQTTKA
jgi:hypothetical protein